MFRKLKEKFTKELVLVILDLTKKIRMKVDVLDYTTEGVLFIECENRKWKPVVFLSKPLNETKRNYKIYNKEILAVIRGLKN